MNKVAQNNKAVIMQTIISANKILTAELKQNYPKLNSVQINAALLLKLEYTSEEVNTILDISDDAIAEVSSKID